MERVARRWVSMWWSITQSLSFQCVGFFVVQLVCVDTLLSLNTKCDFLQFIGLGFCLWQFLCATKRTWCVCVCVCVCVQGYVSCVHVLAHIHEKIFGTFCIFLLFFSSFFFCVCVCVLY